MNLIRTFLAFGLLATLAGCPDPNPLRLTLGQCVTDPYLNSRLRQPLDTIQDRDSIDLPLPTGLHVLDGNLSLVFPDVRSVRLQLDAGCIQKMDIQHPKRPLKIDELPAVATYYADLVHAQDSPELKAMLAGLSEGSAFPLGVDFVWASLGYTLVLHRDRAEAPDAPPASTYYVTVNLRDDALIRDLYAKSTAARALLGKPEGPVMVVEYPKADGPKRTTSAAP